MKKNNRVLRDIQTLYSGHRLNVDDIYKKSKTILSIYRTVIWSTLSKAEEIHCEGMDCYGGNSLETALIYLAEFAPLEQQSTFENKIISLFETKWIIGLIDNAIMKIKDYPFNGQMYHEILLRSFTSSQQYKETELLELLRIERSTFYEKKREAVMLFGIALWGCSIPELRNSMFTD